MLINPNCLRCGTPFTADLPDWMPTATCDRCASELLAYVTHGRSRRHTLSRIAAARRLYARHEDKFVTDDDGDVLHVDDVLPCEVDFTPEPAPAYDEVVIISGEGDDPERDAAFRTFLNRQAAAARGNQVSVVPTHIDPMYEAVARGEARARAHADRSRTGFGQSLTDGAI